jgi:hypothetical protein
MLIRFTTRLSPSNVQFVLRHLYKSTAEANNNMIRSSQLTVMSIKEFFFFKKYKNNILFFWIQSHYNFLLV